MLHRKTVLQPSPKQLKEMKTCFKNEGEKKKSKIQISGSSKIDLSRCYSHPFLSWNLHCSCYAKDVSIHSSLPVHQTPPAAKAFSKVSYKNTYRAQTDLLAVWPREESPQEVPLAEGLEPISSLDDLQSNTPATNHTHSGVWAQR